ncbi:LolA family protein [Paenarthrobacter nicotinovorans]|uniref:LolA family protein n=1 Tax=Paenarthrobacter nicotinovorans TaxID=29320 RepID=UPI0004B04BED
MVTRSKQRWLPAVVVSVVAAMTVAFGSIQAGAAASLPDKTPEEILAMVARSEVRDFSGTLEQSAALGLPEMPAAGPGTTPGAVPAMELLTGTHTARVYVDGPSKARFQVMDRMAERDVVVNGRGVWFYNSADNSAVHFTAPMPTGAVDMAPRDLPTPGSMANRLLAGIEASTEVSVDESSTVAGRSAYRLSLRPRDASTLVDSVAIDVDAETGLALGVEVRAKGQEDPAYSLAFTELSLTVPEAALFEFTPPPGSTVTEKVLPARPAPAIAAPTPQDSTPEDSTEQANPKQASPEPGSQEPDRPRPTVIGQGWDAVIALPAGAAPAAFTANPQLAQALQPVSGGRALTTSLLSVLILDDGRVFAGMVPLERLQSAAAAL